MASEDFVYVVYEKNEDGIIGLIEAHSSNDNAKAASKALKSKGSSNVEVKKLELKSSAEAAAPKVKATANTKAKATKKAKSPEPGDDEDGGDDETATKKQGPKEKGKATNDSRKTMPDGAPDSLKGLNLLFTGTMEKDRKTMEATAKVHGAQVISKLEDTDFVILGNRPGQKKLDIISEHDLATITEAEFFDMLKNGVPKQKREQVAAKAGDDQPAKKKQKK